MTIDSIKGTEDPDALFWRLRVAYLRGAEWRDKNGSMELSDKASYDYADKITSPLSPALSHSSVEQTPAPVSHLVSSNEAHDLGLRAAVRGFSTATPYSEAYAKEQMSAAIGRYLDASGLMMVSKDNLRQEECAGLIDHMLAEPTYRDNPQRRLALAIAARAIRRGRHLTAEEQFNNVLDFAWHAPSPEKNLRVPTIERLADLIDDAAPGILRPDTRLRIASHIRAALAAEGRE